MDVLRTDCLVIGGGLAGSAYALHAAEAGLEVTLLSLGKALDANSDWAQGGIIYDTSPDPELLARDILEASDDTANPAAVLETTTKGRQGKMVVNGQEYNNVMPAMSHLSDEHLSLILSFVYNSWDNPGGMIAAREVQIVKRLISSPARSASCP